MFSFLLSFSERNELVPAPICCKFLCNLLIKIIAITASLHANNVNGDLSVDQGVI